MISVFSSSGKSNVGSLLSLISLSSEFSHIQRSDQCNGEDARLCGDWLGAEGVDDRCGYYGDVDGRASATASARS